MYFGVRSAHFYCGAPVFVLAKQGLRGFCQDMSYPQAEFLKIATLVEGIQIWLLSIQSCNFQLKATSKLAPTIFQGEHVGPRLLVH